MSRWGSLALALTAAGLAGLGACSGSRAPGRSSTSPSSDSASSAVAETDGRALRHHFEGLTLQSSYGCAIADGGVLWCWGDDPARRLGMREGEADPQRATRVSGLDAVEQVVSARSSIHETTCVLLDSAQVYCGRIGPQRREIAFHQIQGLEGVEQLAAQRDVCARTREGAVYCWSPEEQGQRGEPQHVLDGAIDIASGLMSCALDANGVVRCWGGALSAQLERISRVRSDGWSAPADGIAIMAKVEGAVEVDIGMHDFCVRRASGEVLCAMAPGTEKVTRPPPLPLEPVEGTDGALDLSLSDQHGCAIDQRGGVRCWGSNAWAQLGDGSSRLRERQSVSVAGLEKVQALATAQTRSCAMTESAVHCWGTSGADEYDHRAPETHVLPFRSRDIQTVGYLTCALGEDGETRCWGPHAATTDAFAKQHFWGDPGGIIAASAPTEVAVKLGGIRAMYASRSLCLLDANHELTCGSFEQPGGPRRRFTLPDQTFQIESRESGVLDLDDGPAGTLMLLQPAKPRLELRYAPTVQRDIRKVPPFTDVIDSVVGFGRACVAHGGGVVDCWDPSRYAQKQTKAVHRVPGLSDAAGLVDLDSVARSCAWTRPGKVVCWRFARPPGELPPPTLIEVDEISDVVELVASEDRLCARRRDSSLACASLTRAEIGEWRELDVPPIVELTAGARHICMIHGDGETRCMGDNHYGQLGSLSPRTVPAPAPIVFVN